MTWNLSSRWVVKYGRDPSLYNAIVGKRSVLNAKINYKKLGDVTIYPTNYFAPMDFLTGQIKLSPEDASSIHHYSALWQTPTNLRHISKKCVRSIDVLVKKWGCGSIFVACLAGTERRIRNYGGKSK